MRTAAARLRDMSAGDRQALVTLRQLSSGGAAPGQMPSAEQMSAIQRAGDLMTADANVASEMGVSKRFSSVSHRVDRFLMPSSGSSGDDDEPMTADQRARLKVRIQRFRDLDRQDAAQLEPHRAEIEALQKQVRLVLHAESMAR
jgi:hypothetical protein